jgi:superfamily II DNA or RNA helicase/HKD family nuclease
MTSDGGAPRDGLYEAAITPGLERLLARLGDTREPRTRGIEAADTDLVVAHHLVPLIRRAVAGQPTEQRVVNAVALANDVVGVLNEHSPQAVDGDDAIAEVAEVLLSITPAAELPGQVTELPRPTTPLSESDLLTNARGEPSIGHEIALELASADQVDLICAFIRWSGIRQLRDTIEQLTAAGTPVRIVTTTYLGSTERRALDELVRLGADVRVSYDDVHTRLHAKAWLFTRRTGYSTAYVGSSNLSATAQHLGLEWNVRLSQIGNPELLAKIRASFDTYWESPQFEDYDPARDADRFDAAITRARAGGRDTRASGPGATSTGLDFTFLDVTPKPFQARILDQLEAERERHGRWRNLVVAATGTGKTVIAALDYRRLRDRPDMPDASLLFVAHRREILAQSRRMFRQVLGDGAFGELYVDGVRPERWRHVFASIQSLASLGADTIDPDRFDVVIVDEFHHAAADTYRALLDHVRPKVLLGLTATPERTDGQPVTNWFGGHFAAELRLWEAIDEGLLAPFQYFGVHDDVDVSHLTWRRGGYDLGELSNLYTGDDLRTRKVLAAVRDKVLDARHMRALGFCVSIDHAEYMARQFTAAGIPAAAVSARTTTAERDDALRQLRDRKINAVFAVDVFNEGVDVPAIDTVLFLRPTESATVFLQQLGRGLRHAPGKDGLTVLDFVGRQHQKFRFDRRFQAITRSTRRAIKDQVEAGFPFLPAGCTIDLDRDVQQLVIDNLRHALPTTRRQRVAELRSLGDVDLATSLHETGLELEDVYRNNTSWTSLRADAGFGPSLDGDSEAVRLQRAIGRLLHIDDAERLDLYRDVLARPDPPTGIDTGDDERRTRLLAMLHFGLWTVNEKMPSYDAGYARLWRHGALRDELLQVLDVLAGRAMSLVHPLGLPLPVPVGVHACYSRDETLAAFGIGSAGKPPTFREGPKWDEASRCDIFFVTLTKSEKDYSPTTLYRDYAISPELFHWESQSTTSDTSPTGRRYVDHRRDGSHVLLFVREYRTTPYGTTMPYMALGPATYVSHEGSRPMAITWRLHRPMPAEMFEDARVAAG